MSSGLTRNKTSSSSGPGITSVTQKSFRVSMQSLHNRSEDHITSTHMRKLEASFHSRTTGNFTTGKVKETALHCSYEKACSTSGRYYRSKNIKKEKNDKRTRRKLAQQLFSWTS